MSVGHAHHPRITQAHLAELARIEQRPWFKRGRAIRKILDRAHSIPWLGGSSIDLKRIYIDPRFRGPCKYRGREVNVSLFVPPVVEHEEVEGILLEDGIEERGARYDYDGAHEMATAAEERKARRIIEQRLEMRWDRNAYQEMFKPFLRVVVKPPWLDIPVDLNTEPYRQDDPDLYRQIEKAILAERIGQSAAGKISKAEADYSPGKPHAHCGLCVHYDGHHGCEIVAGRIEPAMWCKYFEGK